MSSQLFRSFRATMAFTVAGLAPAFAESIHDAPQGALHRSVPGGLSSLAVPLAPTIYQGLIASNTPSTVTFATGEPAASLQPGRPAYVELLNGPFEGERLDVDLEATAAAPVGQVVLLLGGGSHSTLTSLGANQIAGHQAVVRHHVRLADFQAMFSPSLVGHNSAARADAVQLYENGALRTYYLRGDNQTWREVGKLADHRQRVIPPDESLLVRLRSGAKAWQHLGEVRTNAFRVRLPAGSRAWASGYPIDLTPVDLGAFVDDEAPASIRWVGSDIPGKADWLRIFAGSEFLPHTLRADGQTWARVGQNTDITHQPVFGATAMVVVTRQNADPDYVIPSPILP